MTAETRTMKALRNVVSALTLTCISTLIGATSMTNSSVAQAQAFSPTTTGVIVILTAKAGVTREQVMAVMPGEIRERLLGCLPALYFALTSLPASLSLDAALRVFC